MYSVQKKVRVVLALMSTGSPAPFSSTSVSIWIKLNSMAMKICLLNPEAKF